MDKRNFRHGISPGRNIPSPIPFTKIYFGKHEIKKK